MSFFKDLSKKIFPFRVSKISHLWRMFENCDEIKKGGMEHRWADGFSVGDSVLGGAAVYQVSRTVYYKQTVVLNDDIDWRYRNVHIVGWGANQGDGSTLPLGGNETYIGKYRGAQQNVEKRVEGSTEFAWYTYFPRYGMRQQDHIGSNPDYSFPKVAGVYEWHQDEFVLSFQRCLSRDWFSFWRVSNKISDDLDDSANPPNYALPMEEDPARPPTKVSDDTSIIQGRMWDFFYTGAGNTWGRQADGTFGLDPTKAFGILKFFDVSRAWTGTRLDGSIEVPKPIGEILIWAEESGTMQGKLLARTRYVPGTEGPANALTGKGMVYKNDIDIDLTANVWAGPQFS